MIEDQISKSENSSAFNVFVRVRPINTSDENLSETEHMVQVEDNQLFIRDPSPLGDYIVSSG